MKAAYIHIPFCEHICHYCDFNKVFLKGQPVDEYISLLIREMELRLEEHHIAKMDTIFVGGGTPTSLNESQLDKLCSGIRRHLPFSGGEFTFEANPGDMTAGQLKVLANYGVNRLSFGVQSFNDELLAAIGRTHRAGDVYKSIQLAQDAGFLNISIDLIYSLPGQTLDDFKSTLQKALDLQLPHYSGYSLIVEPKTVFYNLMRKGRLQLPGQDTEALMYELLMEEMAKKGLVQYEISNFSAPGMESRHNLVYWNNEEYFGFGAGAHGYVNRTRYSNAGPLKKYMEPLRGDQLPTFDSHEVTQKERMEEEMFLGLRKTAGVSIPLFEDKYGMHPMEVFPTSIKEMEQKELLETENGRIRLTKKGRFLGNEVFQSFLI
ncbi:MAG TPA: radical SAM family heme chaperone HemW [Bacillaceae bacterium]